MISITGNSFVYTYCYNTIMFDFTWYQSLIQPPLAPPSWLFSPVWTCLYISILVSLILYIKKYSINKKTWGYVLFFTQLLVNFAWTPAFFGVKNIELAFIIIVLLDILIILNIIEFSKVSKASGYILIPYLIWVLFATYLNLGIMILN